MSEVSDLKLLLAQAEARIARMAVSRDALYEALKLVDEDVRHHLRHADVAPALLRPHAIHAVRAVLAKCEPGNANEG